MGLFRFLFALSIVIAHSTQVLPYNIGNSEIAVLSFFVISGFYMALILDKKYVGKNNSYFLFITNRFLRIYPIYWVMLLVVVFFALVKFFSHIGTPDNAIIHYFSNADATLKNNFLLQTINFIIRNVTLILSADYFFNFSKTSGYLIIQQAWTLQVEFLFYLLAPFILRVKRLWFYVFLILYIIIFYGIISSYHLFPFFSLTYTFFPFFIYFCLGCVSYDILTVIKKYRFSKFLLLTIFIFFIVYIFAYQFLPHLSLPFPHMTDVLYFFIFTLVLPFIFLLTKQNYLDRFIGELSYPVYIDHIFVIKTLDNIRLSRNSSFMMLVICFSLLLAYALVKYIDNPIDIIRQKRLKKRFLFH